jgi:hypothetical protein
MGGGRAFLGMTGHKRRLNPFSRLLSTRKGRFLLRAHEPDEDAQLERYGSEGSNTTPLTAVSPYVVEVPLTEAPEIRRSRRSDLRNGPKEQNPTYGPLAQFSIRPYFVHDTQQASRCAPNAPLSYPPSLTKDSLSCFWNLRGCDSVRQVVPLLWKDSQEILAATAARLTPKDPCPARILAGRVRSLPDLNVALLEVVGSREGQPGG